VELFGLSPTELFVIVLVAVLVFGGRLPQVAGEAAATVQKLRRALTDLRRESGIDQEIQSARREIEQSVVRPFREADVVGTVRREVNEAQRVVSRTVHATLAEPPSAPLPSDEAAAQSSTSPHAASQDAPGEPVSTEAAPQPSEAPAGELTPPDPAAPSAPRPG
jgi:Sec-independent protein translocase protein TatA